MRVPVQGVCGGELHLTKRRGARRGHIGYIDARRCANFRVGERGRLGRVVHGRVVWGSGVVHGVPSKTRTASADGMKVASERRRSWTGVLALVAIRDCCRLGHRRDVVKLGVGRVG